MRRWSRRAVIAAQVEELLRLAAERLRAAP